MQRAEALHRRHVLRHTAQCALDGARHVECLPSLRAISSAPVSPRTGTTRPLRSAADLTLHVAIHLPLARCLESRLLPQDAGVQLLELRARLDPELADEDRARIAEHLQRFCLPSATVERQHAQRGHALAQRGRGSEGFEPPITSRWSPSSMSAEMRSSSIELQLLEALSPVWLLPGEVGQRSAPPQRERAADSAARSEAVRSAPAGPASRTGLRRSSQGRLRGRTRDTCLNDVGAEHSPQLGDAVLNDVVAVPRGWSPQSRSTSRSVETTYRGDDKRGEERALPLPSEGRPAGRRREPRGAEGS